ncbi:MAG: 3-hydroxyacyl-CoA dehydrogenase family protein [Deltaproteobacteria bacterium]|nr:3-hydroxyacyl-CoA dehydrogenase family protein [Deltaproteobacteria bacterium]
MNIQNVAVIGAGTMGNGIAQVVSTPGYRVWINDINEEILEKAKASISASLDRIIRKGKINADDKREILGRITFMPELKEALKDADVVIEAVLENLELKKQLFGKLDTFCKPKAILASNTSQFSITAIASGVADPSRVIGMHWFNPPVIMKLIEIVRGLETSDETVEQIRQFAASVGKEVVVCRDSQGFISTRVLVALRLECYRLLEEGVATKEDIDKTLRLAFGHPMGQFELADLSGLDIEVPICEALAKVYGERYRPPQALLQLVAAGRIGRKSGNGWYDYDV